MLNATSFDGSSKEITERKEITELLDAKILERSGKTGLEIESVVAAVEHVWAQRLEKAEASDRHWIEEALAGKQAQIQLLSAENASLRAALNTSTAQISALTQTLYHRTVSKNSNEARIVSGETIKMIDVEPSLLTEPDRPSYKSVSALSNAHGPQMENGDESKAANISTEPQHGEVVSNGSLHPENQRRIKQAKTPKPVNAAEAEQAAVHSTMKKQGQSVVL